MTKVCSQKKIKEDLPLWINFIKNDGNPNNYSYSATNELMRKNGYKIYHVLIALSEIGLDYISSREISHILAIYFNEHLKFYRKKESSEDLGKLKEIMLDSLFNLNDFMLDNPILLDFWGEILFNLLDGNLDIMKLSDIDKLDFKGDEEKIETIFQAIKFSAKTCDWKYYDFVVAEAKKCELVKNNIELFDKIMDSHDKN